LLTAHDTPAALAATSRWRVAAAGSTPHAPFDAAAPGRRCWRLTLERCRHGPEAVEVITEWSHEALRFDLAAPLAGRAAEAGPARLHAR